MSFSSFPRSRPVSVSSMVYRTLRSKLLLQQQQQQQPTSAIVAAAAAAAAANAGSNSNGRNRNKNWNHRCLSTYYDSQSGLHLPVHDEREIRLFLNVTNGYAAAAAAAAAPDDNGNSNIDGGEEPTTIHKHRHKPPLVPHRLSKDRLEAEELQETLYRLVQKGIHGVILPPVRFPRDVRNLQTLSAIAPPEFVFITNSDSNSDSSGSCSDETNSDSDPDQNSNSNSNSTTVDDAIVKASSSSSSSSYSEKPTAATFSRVLRYNHHHQTANGVQLSLRESLQDSVRKGVHTTLAVDEDAYGSNGNNNNDDDDRPEPITLANNIAALIDAGGGCDYLWISSKSKQQQQQRSSDTMVEVCEELMYLDVAGATIKSRLLVDSVNEDMLEDILFAGVNKYVIGDESEAEMVEAAAEEQGKKLLRS